MFIDHKIEGLVLGYEKMIFVWSFSDKRKVFKENNSKNSILLNKCGRHSKEKVSLNFI